MGTPHKHRDVIIAWANGEEIEYQDGAGYWYPFTASYPPYDDTMTYRIKPKRVKKEGWVNIYPSGVYCCIGQIGSIWSTESYAEKYVLPELITRIRIEWEEEI